MPSQQNDDHSETRPRNKRTATLLTALNPGLGYMYIGQLNRAVVANGILMAALAIFVLLFSLLDFFPLVPFVVVAAGWLLATVFAISDVRTRIDDLDEAYELRSYNHWTIYAAVLLVTFILPATLIAGFANTFFWGLQSVESTAMYPNLRPGDHVLIAKDAYRKKAPKPGDLVALQFMGSDDYQISRVIAAGEEKVRVSGNTVYVGKRQLPQALMESPDKKAVTPLRDDYSIFVEQNGGSKYVVSLSPSKLSNVPYRRDTLREGQLFLLPDNRSGPDGDADSDGAGDNPYVGSVRREAVAGRPLYVAWSTSPETGAIRWNRIGLRLR